MDSQSPEANAKKRSRSAMSPKPELIPLPEIFSSATTTHTVGFGITSPPPQNSRVEVKRFAEVIPLLEAEIRSQLARSRVNYHNVDIEYVALMKSVIDSLKVRREAQKLTMVLI